jgi:hypothetical protein
VSATVWVTPSAMDSLSASLTASATAWPIPMRSARVRGSVNR